jgi:hypothetical protein
VYAAWVAGGFAFTENILYFGSEVATHDELFGLADPAGLTSGRDGRGRRRLRHGTGRIHPEVGRPRAAP